jgi:hypothetical protein
MISRPFLIHLLFMLLGYVLAVLTATTVVCVVTGLPTVFPDQGEWGSFYRYLDDLPAMFVIGLMMTALYALPGWLISVVTAEVRNEKRKYWFAFTGFVTAVLAHMISGGTNFAMFANIAMTISLLTVAILIGGFFGGLVYWALAGKRSGGWKLAKAATNGQAAI